MRRRTHAKDSAGALWTRVREQGGLRIPGGIGKVPVGSVVSDMRTEWREYVAVAGPGLLKPLGLEPDVMSTVLGFDSETDLLDALIKETVSRRRPDEWEPDPSERFDESRLTEDERHTWALCEALILAMEGGQA